MAFTDYYVSAAGGGAHDGTTAADALTPAEMRTQINALGAGGAAGRRYNFIEDAYTLASANFDVTVGGTATSPLIIRGYSATLGDIDTGTRDAYGALDTGNHPAITVPSAYRIRFSAAHVVVMGLNVSGSINGGLLQFGGGSCGAINCKAANSSTGASALAFSSDTAGGVRFINCDASIGASGGIAAIEIGAASEVVGCRVTAPGGAGIRVSQGVILNAVANTIYGCGTHGISLASSGGTIRAYHNTIYGCTDNGIEIISTATATGQLMVGNHITDNGGYGIDFNGGTAGATAFVLGNRFRDNTSGNTNGFADYVTGTDARNITTDSGGASTDYVDAATNKDFRLISTAAGYRQGFAYNANIGACGDNITPGEKFWGRGQARGLG